MTRLSSKRKRRIAQKARTDARVSNAGAGAAAKAQISSANKEYNRTARDARGAQRVETSQLNQMLRSIAGSGLKGKAAAQTVQGLRSAKLEASTGVPFALSDAARTRSDTIAAAQADLASARAQTGADFRNNLESYIDDAKAAKEDRISDSQSAAEDKKAANRGVRNALVIANNYLSAAEKKDGQKGINALLSNEGAFAQGVASKTEGADISDAVKAINLLKKHRAKLKKQFPVTGW